MALISVVIPTITGREHWFERCVAAYEACGGNLEFVVVRDKPTVGVAWQEGAEKASGDYLHLGNDDCEAQHGWWQAAVKVSDRGETPAGPVLNPDGTVNSLGEWGENEHRAERTPTTMTRIPFCTMEQWTRIGPMLPIHYFTDNWFSWRARQAGIQPVICNGYRFIHHLAPEGRLGREGADHDAYRAAGGQ